MTGPVPYAFARDHNLVVLEDGETCLMTDKTPVAAVIEAQRYQSNLLRLRKVSSTVLADHIEKQYRDSAHDAAGAAASADAEGVDLAELANSAAAVDDLLDQRNDAPVVRLINALLLEAIRENASDVHIEVEEKRLVVRFRIDGVMREVLEPSRALAPLLSSRIKVMGRLDISEKRIPQDGRVSLRVGEYELDVRISTLPAQYGERVVLRLLDRGQTRAGVSSLGMRRQARDAFKRILHRPDGIVLVTGPTGSGKTTTLYAALDALNDRQRNIMTIEDPIEYALAGVGQMQVNAATELTFARGLRAILRQDPDVIMVGEIRDGETARIAVESAMTGHLVLSTLHTNTAVGSIARLVDLGVQRFLLAPMVRGLVAQRLVRRICPGCSAPRALTPAEATSLGASGDEVTHQGAGCSACAQSGYRGRVALYEVIEGTGELERGIVDGLSEAQLVTIARKTSHGLIDDGMDKIRAGLTTPQEVLRVAYESGA
ncbi:Flp pilus assembly complex ATPase component TadA [Roseobacter sp. YSTF-M11]|uniref:General secretion pathway protein E n=1 Tax=Roseobacter insulae TaxID=2859783 RepID=A0A9X1K2C5_9RHOB|nr:ATPase, T2SS/T4P/T4SS family [Roseobacter insulae]MBW4707427.1 Flp pilus assembly complex ATPase component TadA [Roseobacter insulae]